MEANRIYIEDRDGQTGRQEIQVRRVSCPPFVPARNVINLQAITARAPTLYLQRVVQIRKSYALA